jgi:class 3 adenylate cyclase/predicted ATPase
MSAISAWLDSLGLGRYAAAFDENAVDLDVVSELTEVDLERMGVALGHRKRILRAISTSPVVSPVVATTQTVLSQHFESEKRQLTMLFCDLVGSTALAVQLDPEDLSTIIRRFQSTCTSVITHNAGYVARYMGDGLLAYFGYPMAHEDEAENAVHAGLDLVAKLGQLLLPSGEPLQVRVGIATGLVIIGDSIAEGSVAEVEATGEAPNLAARLQQLAAPDSVIISEVTRSLLGGGFVCERLQPSELKGFPEPVTAFKVTGERALESRFDAKHTSRLTPLVGRQRELAQLEHLWALAKRGECQVALLCGEPGIGKSRISIALLDHIETDQHVTVRWQCSSHHANSPLFPVIRHLERTACFERDDSPQVKLEKLEAMISRAGQATLANAALYAALLSIPSSGRYLPLNLTPSRQKDLTIDALIRQLLAYASTQPVLFLLEDMHWIDPTTLELINRTIESIKTATVLMLITFRPDFFPPWLDRSHVTMLRLERLGRDQVGAMISDLATGKELPAEVLEMIISKTDGVPLFVEEMTKAILETNAFESSGERYTTPGQFAVPAIPVTLHDSLMARLDRLAPIKEIAQIGATIGREFPYRLLAAVAPMTDSALKVALARLGAAELIFGRGEPPESNYTFKHALVQDTAYGSLVRSKRQQLHSKIADALEEHFPQTVQTQPELMAHHLEQAGLIERAIDFLLKAGKRSVERSANPEAIRHLTRALDLLESIGGGERSNRRLELKILLAQAMIAGRGYAAPETKAALVEAKALIDEWTDPASKFAVLYGLWACRYVGGEVALQQMAAAEFLAEAERQGVTSALCLSHRTLGTTYVNMGEFEAGRRHLEQARALYNPELESESLYQYGQDIGATALCYLCWALWQLGYVDQATEVAAEAVKHAEALSHPHTLAYTICHAQGMMDIFRRCPTNTHSYARKLISLCTEHNFPFWAAGGQILDGWATCHDELDQGLEVLRAGLSAWRKTGARLWLPVFIALEAEAHATGGRFEAAVQAIDQAITVSNETGERWAIAEVLRLKAWILSTAGRGTANEIENLLAESIETARRQRARVWELRASCDLARLRRGQGREHEALKLLQSIYDQFTEGFGTADLLDAKALMESLDAAAGRKRSGHVRTTGGADRAHRKVRPSKPKGPPRARR